MRISFKTTIILAPLGLIALPGSLSAQAQGSADPNIVVIGAPLPEAAVMTKGPEINGIISARNDDKMRVTSADGNSTVIAITQTTRIRSGGGLFGGGSQLPANALLNGLPVKVKTMQSGTSLMASEISFRNNDFKTATMIRNGTAQQFDEQTAATQALRGRMGDIDNYNIKSTTNVYFPSGKSSLSAQARTELCATASAAEGMNNAMMLVVGYTDSVGSDEYNQSLSERRASSVINYLQQACRWKPYRVLTPTGMAEADPVASNETIDGKAQNRRVSVNILVSKGLDGL